MATLISANMNRWKDAVKRKDNDYIVSLFEQGNAFRYVIPTNIKQEAVLHVYPGITEDSKLLFYVIPAEYDTPAHAADYQNYTKACPIESGLGGGNEISDLVAKARIQNWKDNYPTWIPAQNATINGVFLAFAIDAIDFKVKNTYVTLGLIANGEQVVPFNADLIVSNIETADIVYADMSQPVPPFGASAAATSFYLLTL